MISALFASLMIAGAPVRTAVVLDGTWSMDQDLGRRAVQLIAGLSCPSDQVALIAMKKEPELLLPLTSAREARAALDAAIDRLVPLDEPAGVTPAIELAFAQVARGPITVDQIFVVTSGALEDGSRPSSVLAAELRAEEIAVYAISVSRGRLPPSLEALAEASGGETVVLGEERTLGVELADLYIRRRNASFLLSANGRVRFDSAARDVILLSEGPAGLSISYPTPPPPGEVLDLGGEKVVAIAGESSISLSTQLEGAHLQVHYRGDAPPAAIDVRLRDPAGEVEWLRLTATASGAPDYAGELLIERSGEHELTAYLENRAFVSRAQLTQNTAEAPAPAPAPAEATPPYLAIVLFTLAAVLFAASVFVARKRKITAPPIVAPPIVASAPEVAPAPIVLAPIEPPPVAIPEPSPWLDDVYEVDRAHRALAATLGASRDELKEIVDRVQRFAALEGLADEHKSRAAAVSDAVSAFQLGFDEAMAHVGVLGTRVAGALERLEPRDPLPPEKPLGGAPIAVESADDRGAIA